MKKLFSCRFFASAIIIAGLVLMSVGYGRSAPHAGSGTVSGLVLDIGTSAKAIGLGEAYTTGLGTAEMNYWNVGAIGASKSIQVSFTHLEWLVSTRMENIYVTCPILNFGVVGLTARFVGYANEKKTLENSDGTFNKEDGTFGGRDIIIGLNYGYDLESIIGSMGFGSLGVGFGLNIISSTYDDKTANAVGANVGLLYRAPIKDLNVGFVMRNVGSKLKYISEEAPLPLNFQLGGSYGLLNRMIVIYTDLKIPTYQYPSIHFGVEVTPIEFVSVRVGYKYGFGGLPLGYLSGLSAGLGVNLPKSILQVGNLSLDYAFVPYGDLGFTHRISLEMGIGMGGSPSSSEEKKATTEEKKTATEEKKIDKPAETKEPPATPTEEKKAE